jgi:hypothetical protein
LHHALSGAEPLPLRLVSITKCAPPTKAEIFLPNAMFSSVET